MAAALGGNLSCASFRRHRSDTNLFRSQKLASTSSSFNSSPVTKLWHTSNACQQFRARQQLSIIAGNKGATGPFAPLVVAVRNVMGTKEFNQFRGKAISLHSQIIKEFGTTIGADIRQVQGLIRLAKKNGEKLGFLA